MVRLLGTTKEIIYQLLELDPRRLYICEVKEPKSKRSLEQNRMLWNLIHLIAKKTNNDDMDVYCSCLERADAKSDYIMTEFEMGDALRKAFRGVKFIRTQEVNGKDRYIYKVYEGSSKMDTKEMSELIDICFQICAENDIPTLEYMYE